MVSGAAKAKGRCSRFVGEKGDFLDAMAAEFINSSDRGSFYSLAATRYIQKFGYAVYGDAPDLTTMAPADKATELERRKKFLPWLRTVSRFLTLLSVPWLTSLIRHLAVGFVTSTGGAAPTSQP